MDRSRIWYEGESAIIKVNTGWKPTNHRSHKREGDGRRVVVVGSIWHHGQQMLVRVKQKKCRDGKWLVSPQNLRKESR